MYNKKAYNRGVKTASFVMGFGSETKRHQDKKEKERNRTVGDNNLNTHNHECFETSWEKKNRGQWY